MKQTRKIIASALALMISVGMMSGCGDTQTQTADTRSMVAEQSVAANVDTDVDDDRGDLNRDGAQDVEDAQLLLQYYTENTLAGNIQSWNTMLGPEAAARADQAAADRTIKQYMEAMKNKDVKLVMKYSDMRDLSRFSDSVLGLEEDMEMQEIDSYTIEEATTDPETLAEFQQMNDKMLADMSAILGDDDADPEMKNLMLVLGYMVKPVTKVYAYRVTAAIANTSSQSTIYVTCDDEGEWYVNSGMAHIIYEFLEMANEAAAKSTAKTLSNAVNATLIELDEEGYSLKDFDGDYRFTGEDFVGLTEPEYGAPVEDELKYRIGSFYDESEISALNDMLIRVKDGICLAAAVEVESNIGATLIGTYPAVSDLSQDATLEEALEQAIAARG